MTGALAAAVQFYTRTRLQRWLLAVTLLLYAAWLALWQGPCARACAPGPAPFLLGGPLIGTACSLLFQSAWDFRRITALRTVSLIPGAKWRLAIGLLLAQLGIAVVGTLLMSVFGAATPPPAPAWGSLRGTFELLAGCTLLGVAAAQLITGPSRVVSVVTSAAVAAVAVRPDLFGGLSLLGLPKADVIALSGGLLWLAYSLWFVSDWRPALPLAAWTRRSPRETTPPDPAAPLSRSVAIATCLLGSESLLRACRPLLAAWLTYHGITLGMQALMPLLMHRHHVLSFTLPILLLLYSPAIVIHAIAADISRGSRRLWLPAAESRAAMFSDAERLCWRALALPGLPLFTLALAEMRLLPHAGTELWFPLAISLASLPIALYLGLLNFRQRVSLSLVALLTVMLSAFLGSGFIDSPAGQRLLWIAPVALLVAGCVFRLLARRRWSGIDWLRWRAAPASSAVARYARG